MHFVGRIFIFPTGDYPHHCFLCNSGIPVQIGLAASALHAACAPGTGSRSTGGKQIRRSSCAREGAAPQPIAIIQRKWDGGSSHGPPSHKNLPFNNVDLGRPGVPGRGTPSTRAPAHWRKCDADPTCPGRQGIIGEIQPGRENVDPWQHVPTRQKDQHVQGNIKRARLRNALPVLCGNAWRLAHRHQINE